MNFKVLIVEDEQIVRTLLSRMILKKFPYCTIIEAKNGLEGLTAVENESPDVIMLDVRMPMMNGYEVLSVLKKSQRHKNTPVFVITNDRERNVVVKFMQMGIAGYLLKPLDAAVIYARLGKILEDLRTASVPVVTTKKSIILIDSDPLFRSFFTATISPFCTVRTTDNLPEAIRMIAERRPTDICITEAGNDNPSLMDERVMAKKIKNATDDYDAHVYLVNKIGLLKQEEVRFFSGAIKRSFTTSDLYDTVLRNIFLERTQFGKVKFTLTNIVATQSQKFIQDNIGLQKESPDFAEQNLAVMIERDMIISAVIVLPQEKSDINITLEGSKSDFQKIACRLQKKEDAILDAFSPMLADIQHKMSSILDNYGLESEITGIDITKDISAGNFSVTSSNSLPLIHQVLKFAGGEKILFGMNPLPSTAVVVAV